MTVADLLVPQAASWREDVLEAGGRQWHYTETGAGEVVLLIDLSDGATSGHAPLDHLADRYRLIAPRLDASPDQHDAWDPRTVARLLGQFVEGLGLSHVAVISRGPATTAALWLAVDNPELVTTLVLESPPLLDAIAADAGDSADLVTAMPSLEVPTLVLLGQRTEAALPQHAGAYKRLPASTVALVYLAGDDVRGERSSAYLAAVTEYLERGQAFVVSNQSTVIHD